MLSTYIPVQRYLTEKREQPPDPAQAVTSYAKLPIRFADKTEPKFSTAVMHRDLMRFVIVGSHLEIFPARGLLGSLIFFSGKYMGWPALPKGRGEGTVCVCARARACV